MAQRSVLRNQLTSINAICTTNVKPTVDGWASESFYVALIMVTCNLVQLKARSRNESKYE